MEFVNQDSKSPRVVEVVDCLGDSVIRVQHLDAQTKKPFAAFVLPLALVFLAIAGGCFMSAVSTASANKAARQAHMASGAAAYTFRPKNVSNGLSWVAGLSALAGLGLAFTFFAGRSREESTAEGFDEADAGGRDMVRVTGEGAHVQFPGSVRVVAQTEQGSLDAEALCTQGLATRDALGALHVGLAENFALRAEQGSRTIHIRWTPKPRAKTFALGFRFDSRFASYMGGSAVAAIVMLAILRSLPVDETSLYGDRFPPGTRFVAVQTSAMEDAVQEPEEGSDGDTGDTKIAEASEAGSKGTTGIESATATEAQMQIKDRVAPPQASREQVRSAASHSGVLGVMREQQLFASLTATANFASGDGARDWYGGINGGPVGDQVGTLSGTWGNDVVGMGQWGTVKVGDRLGRIAMSGGTCDAVGCEGQGSHGTSLRKHTAGRPVLKIGPTQSSTGLDRSIIRRYIKKKILRIQHCYEKRLLAAPSLAGTLTSSFSIGGNGEVIGSSASGIGDAALQGCVSNVVASIKFPRTSGGSVVNVRYPFIFHSAGE